MSEEQSLEGILQNFYKELSDKQEPLGSEFRKVLEDNLWDLYEDSDDELDY